jgi:hypothetical protein
VTLAISSSKQLVGGVPVISWPINRGAWLHIADLFESFVTILLLEWRHSIGRRFSCYQVKR